MRSSKSNCALKKSEPEESSGGEFRDFVKLRLVNSSNVFRLYSKLNGIFKIYVFKCLPLKCQALA